MEHALNRLLDAIFHEDKHTDTLIHLFHNPKMRIRIHRRESDPGFFK